MDIVPFQRMHIEKAAGLVSRRYRELRRQVPQLPSRYEQVSQLLPLLSGMLGADGPGAAALEGEQLVGFIKGWLMPDFKGKPSVYSPEWANGAESAHSRAIYEALYRHIAAEWVEQGFTTHYIGLLANDPDALVGFHWLGFGMLGVDAVRGLEPEPVPAGTFTIRAAGPEDLDAVLELHQGLRQYARSSPYFFLSNQHDRRDYQDWIYDPERVIWLAEQDGQAVAFLRMGPANDDVATIIVDEGTTSIYEAYTVESRRGAWIGSVLLQTGIRKARQAGYSRCAVDFETMNTRGSHFWFKKGFEAVSLSLMRTIDEAVVTGEGMEIA